MAGQEKRRVTSDTEPSDKELDGGGGSGTWSHLLHTAEELKMMFASLGDDEEDVEDGEDGGARQRDRISKNRLVVG